MADSLATWTPAWPAGEVIPGQEQGAHAAGAGPVLQHPVHQPGDHDALQALRRLLQQAVRRPEDGPGQVWPPGRGS